MSEITITIPYWLPTVGQFSAFLAWWLPVGVMVYLASFFATAFNRRNGCAPIIARSSVLMGLCITAAAVAFWPLPLATYAVKLVRHGRVGR